MANNANKPKTEGTQTSTARPGDGPRSLFLLNEDLWIAIAIWAFCALTYAITLGFDEVPPMIAQGLPPDRFPQMMVGVIAVLTLVMVYQESRKPLKERKTVKSMVFYSGALLLGFVALMTWVDVIIAMPVFVIALSYAWGERRIVPLIIYALIFSAFVFALFVGIMEVVFPSGPLTDLFR